MNTNNAPHPDIVPRENLDFGLDQAVPRYWLNGDPFKSRFFDAMSIVFPEGERYFISCVRDFRDQITDPKLKQEIKDFIRQEGQHGLVHGQFNAHLKAQGVAADRLESLTRWFLFDVMRKFMPKKHTLASTAACEHLTAILSQAFFERQDMLAGADPRMFALYAWHAMEETEHRAVAFDVMQKVAQVGYLRRAWTQVEVTMCFNLQILVFTGLMLHRDGISLGQGLKLFAKGLWWVYGPKGLFTGSWRTYLRYFKPHFHPLQGGESPSYRIWLDAFNRSGDPIEAGRALRAEAS